MHVVSLLCSDVKLPDSNVPEARGIIRGLGIPPELPTLTRVG